MTTSSTASIRWNDLDHRTFFAYSTLYILFIDFVMYPADMLTTRLQADQFMDHGRVNLWRMTSDIVKTDGWKGLFRGFGVNTVGSFPGQFIYYVSYEYANRLYAHDILPPRLSCLSHALAGASAEAFSAFSYVPTDVICQRLQTHVSYSFIPKRLQNASMRKVVGHIWMTEGWRGFFRGYFPYLTVYAPSSAVWWSVYEACKYGLDRIFYKHKSIHSNSKVFESVNYLISGSVAGAASIVATNPLDVARTRLQLLEVAVNREKRTLRSGFYSILKQVFQNEGWRGLYKGMKPRIWVRTPGCAVTLCGYEYLKSVSVSKSSEL